MLDEIKSPVKEVPAEAAALRLIACAVGLVLTAVLLLSAAGFLGHPEKTISGNQKIASADGYRMTIGNKIASALKDLSTAERPTFWISKDTLVPPAPNQALFGETEDPQDLQEIIDKAYFLLEGQELFFDPSYTILENSIVSWYLDDTILTITWKLPIMGSAYTFTEVKVAHPSQFRRFLSDGEFGSGKLYTTSQMARSVNAVVAASADYYSYRFPGVTVYNGEVKRANSGLPDTCFVDENGDLILTESTQYTDFENMEAFVADNNINFSLSFGPNLIVDGERVEPNAYPIGEINDEFSRAALCQMDKLHYLVVNANMEYGFYRTPTIHGFADVIERTGCKQAYTLDGGQTATTVVNGDVFNNVNYGSERLISDIIYFATAIPDGG